MANKTGSKIRTWVLGNREFTISWDFKSHQRFGGSPKLFAGIDIGTQVGTNIYAPESGIVYRSRPATDGAEIICLKHKTCMTEYVHLLARLVEKGQKIKKGQLIGRTGKSGKVTGPHLHFALIKGTTYVNSKRIDPYAFLLGVSDPNPRPKLAPQPTLSTSPITPNPSPKPVLSPELTPASSQPENSAIIEGGDEKMDESKRFTLSKEDLLKWGKNLLIFAGPALLVLIASLVEEIPDDWKYGAIALYV